VPYKYYEENNIRRWGAHGTSHRFVTARVCEVLGVKPEDVRIITCVLKAKRSSNGNFAIMV
jgi:acetate kinase